MIIETLSAADFLSRNFNSQADLSNKFSSEIFFEIECHGNSRPPYWDKRNYAEILTTNVQLALSCEGQDIQAFIIYREIKPEIEILHWAVREKGQGLGEEFLRQFLNCCDAKKILLDCGEKNLAAKALYDKLGFKVDYRRENYYSTGEAALLMSLEQQ